MPMSVNARMHYVSMTLRTSTVGPRFCPRGAATDIVTATVLIITEDQGLLLSLVVKSLHVGEIYCNVPPSLSTSSCKLVLEAEAWAIHSCHLIKG
jgi:hypothetical protein